MTEFQKIDRWSRRWRKLFWGAPLYCLCRADLLGGKKDDDLVLWCDQCNRVFTWDRRPADVVVNEESEIKG